MAQLSSHNARARHWWPSQQTETAIIREQGRISERHAYLYLRLDERNTTGCLRQPRTEACESKVVDQSLPQITRARPVYGATLRHKSDPGVQHY